MSQELDSIVKTLESRYGAVFFQQEEKPTQIRLLFRIPSAQTAAWVAFRQHMLRSSVGTAWSYDCSRQDRLKDNMLVWGWRIILQHDPIQAVLPEIQLVMTSVSKPYVEIDEQPIPGRSGQRNMMNSLGKGAASAGSVPLLVARRGGMR